MEGNQEVSMMPVTNLEIFFTIALLAGWFLFPIGLFISVGRLDKDSDQLQRIEHGDPALIALHEKESKKAA
jgi:hypothetical protein